MTSKPSDPWYPCKIVVDPKGENFPGVTIRLKLAAEFSAALIAAAPLIKDYDAKFIRSCVGLGTQFADAQIKRANRDEGSDDGK